MDRYLELRTPPTPAAAPVQLATPRSVPADTASATISMSVPALAASAASLAAAGSAPLANSGEVIALAISSDVPVALVIAALALLLMGGATWLSLRARREVHQTPSQ